MTEEDFTCGLITSELKFFDIQAPLCVLFLLLQQPLLSIISSKMPSNIVIIGASGGAMVARDLLKKLPSDHSIILIDSQEVAFHRISSLRSAVLPGHETKSVADLQDFFPKGSNHKVVIAKVQGIEQGSVTLDREVDGSNKVEYKYLVVATGSKYAFPASAQGTSKEEILSAFRDTQEQVKSAEHILIVGGE